MEGDGTYNKSGLHQRSLGYRPAKLFISLRQMTIRMSACELKYINDVLFSSAFESSFMLGRHAYVNHRS